MSDKIYLNARFGFRHDTLSNWQSENPVLLKGEISIVSDAENENWLKIGDGATAWNDLPYKVGPSGEQGIQGEKGPKGDKGDTGDVGPQGEQGERGYSGLVPQQTVECAYDIILLANTHTVINTLTGDINITLGDAVNGYANEWIAVITQGDTAYSVNLPNIEWQLGIAPTFAADTTTEIRLYYVDSTLKGVWC